MRIIRKIERIEKPVPTKKRVAAYARVSSEKDASLKSLSSQISYYSEYILKHPGWEYIGVYADEGVTGTCGERPEFQKLMADCRAGKIDMVITKSISRFARNTLTMLEAVRELKELNINVYFERENIYSMSGDGELMLTILASFAQEESRSVSENCKWRIRKGFAKGELINLRFLYGYHICKGRIEVNEAEAEVVRRIFLEYLEGKGCSSIAKELKAADIPRPRGGSWNSEKVANILKNEKYTGNALLQKRFVTDHLTKKLEANGGRLPMYFAEGTHPAIIETETFELAGKLLQENHLKNKPKRGRSRYPFTSMITCGHCGKQFKRKISGGRVYWNCSTYLKFGVSACPSKQIPESILESLGAKACGSVDFDESLFQNAVKGIRSAGPGELEFQMADGSILQERWENPSRSRFWTQEKREIARRAEEERTLRRNK